VPLDGSLAAEEVLGPATEVVRWTGAEVVLLRAVDDAGADAAPPPPGPTRRPALAEARRYLGRIATRLRAGGASVRTRAVVGDPAGVIASVAQGEGADLIAMATRGRGGLARAVLGSVATATLEQARVPVLLVRPVGRHERP
jgi:nucleotide-binding universal stress UspA family protein